MQEVGLHVKQTRKTNLQKLSEHRYNRFVQANPITISKN